jgi:hypothetical protein
MVVEPPPAGSRMTAATSPRWSTVSTALMSLGGHSRICSSVADGTPADHGTSYGGSTASATPSCQPWKWPWNLRTFGRFV